MKLFIAAIFCVAVGADRLENTYLPPSGAQTAGGDGNVLNAPLGSPDPSGKHEDFHSYRRTGNEEHSGLQNPDANAATLRFQNDNNADGTYHFKYETENRIFQQESGELRNLGDEEGGVTVVRGSYSYLAPDGIMYTVEYIADENGFQPSGEHIHQAIQKATQVRVGDLGYPGENEQNHLNFKSGSIFNNNAVNEGYSTRSQQNQINFKSESNSNNEEYHVGQKTTAQDHYNSNTISTFNSGKEIGFNPANHHSVFSQKQENRKLQSTEERNSPHSNNQHHEESGYPQSFAPKNNLNSGVITNQKGNPNNIPQLAQRETISSEGQKNHGYPNNALNKFVQQGPSTSNAHKNTGFPNNSPQGFIPQEAPGNYDSQHATGYPISSHGPTGYPVSSGSQHLQSQGQSGYPVSSGSHTSHSQSGYPISADSQTLHGSAVSSGTHDSHSLISSGLHESQDHSGYPVSSGSHESQGQFPISSGASHQHTGYPSNVPQGFAPQQEHPVSAGIHLDNIDSSHQHLYDDAQEEDAVVVEAAAGRYKPPQVPRERATLGQQAFNEQTGYQY